MPERKEERFETDLAIRFEGGEGVAHNVSANGIYFTTDAAFRVGQPVKLTFELSTLSAARLQRTVSHVSCGSRRGARRGVGASIGSFEMRRVAPGKSSKS